MESRNVLLKKIIMILLSAAMIFAYFPLAGTQKAYADTYYTIKFVTNGGTQMQDLKVKAGEAPYYPENQTKLEGKVLGGWYCDQYFSEEFNWDKKVTHNVTLYAKWLDPVTVKFDSNRGTPVDSITIGKGQCAYEPYEELTKTGYVFVGWYSDSSLTKKYDFDDPVNENITLYAKWGKPCKVTFDSNDGSAVDTQTVGEGGRAYRPEDPKKSGSAFIDWYSDSQLTKIYDFDEPVTKDITLYAKWGKGCTVTFDTNGGSDDIDSRIVAKGQALDWAERPEKDGQIFIYWCSDRELTERYDFAEPVTKDITLYAKWGDPCKVTFETNGGSYISGDIVGKGSYVDEPAAPKKSGKAFGGWYSDQALTKEYDFDAPVSGDITLYAKWLEKVTVTFDSNGGSPVKSQEIAIGSRPEYPDEPQKSGKAFDGWYTNKELTKEYDFDEPVTKDTTLYAKWKNAYTVTFNTNGGSQVDPIKVGEGDKFWGPGKDPVKAGYGFVGWYTDEALTKPYKPYSLTVTKDITIYAKWSAPFYVTYKLNDGQVLYQDVVGEGATSDYYPEVEKEGYELDYWYVDQNCTEPYNTSTPVSKDITLYAKWLKEYKVQFDPNGGSFGDWENKYLLAAEGQNVDKPHDPTKSGYALVGWYTDKALTKPYDFNAPVTHDLTLYAKWGEVCKITFIYWEGKCKDFVKVGKGAIINEPEYPGPDIDSIITGWYTDKKLTHKYDFSKPVTSDIILYAKYEPCVFITFYYNTSFTSGCYKSFYSRKNDKIKRPADSELNGYKFDGWYLDPACTKPFDFDTKVTSELDLYAKWTKAEDAAEDPGSSKDPGKGGDTSKGNATQAENISKSIKNLEKTRGDSDPKGSSFGSLRLLSNRSGKKSISLKWSDVSGASKYVLFANKCGSKYKKVAVLNGSKKTLTKAAGKKLKKGTYYKFFVAAYDKDGKLVAVSKTVFAATRGGKSGNYKAVKVTNVKKSKLTLKSGKSFRIKTKLYRESNKLKVKKHCALRYESTNTKVAVVTAKGKIKAKADGKCVIYVYTQSGTYTKVNVTVK
jgi:uncharacterized repeat protein (TIGR02543 family)